MNQKELKEYIKNESYMAAQHLDLAKAAVRKCDKSEFCKALESFVYTKLLIDPNKCRERDLISLAELSTNILISLADGDVSASDISVGCLSMDTPLTKKIILIFALKEELCAEFDPSMVTEMETIDSLCERMWVAIPKGEKQNE